MFRGTGGKQKELFYYGIEVTIWVTRLTPDKKNIRAWAWGRFRNSKKRLEITAVSYLVPHLY